MAKIVSQGKTHQADFAGHRYRITEEGKDLIVHRLGTGDEAINVTNKGELRSLMSFYNWHRQQRRPVSELHTFFIKKDQHEEE